MTTLIFYSFLQIKVLTVSLHNSKKNLPVLQRRLEGEQAKVIALQSATVMQKDERGRELEEKVKYLQDQIVKKDARIRELESRTSENMPMGPELREICTELGRAREKEKHTVGQNHTVGLKRPSSGRSIRLGRWPLPRRSRLLPGRSRT